VVSAYAGETAVEARTSFGDFVARAHRSGRLVVQPRMGFAPPGEMRAGLLATKGAAALTAGTITLDSYTRTGDHAAARRALAGGTALNGYPLVSHGAATTRAVLTGVRDGSFPVQVRHGSPDPRDIVAQFAESGLDATEGGPVSYCLPYGRTPLRVAVDNWARCTEMLAGLQERGPEPHLESFGGCLLGQLCPPSILVATSVLEGVFFRQHGMRSVSLSYAQQTNAVQDEEALRALRRLAGEVLADIDWHVVLYAYMGVYPSSRHGALRLLADAARLAVRGGAARLIVKTAAEAHRIPTVAENVEALEVAAESAQSTAPSRTAVAEENETYAEARALVDAVLDLDDDTGTGLVRAFARGYLDVPHCLHADNRGRARSYLDDTGRLRWAEFGSVPIADVAEARPSAELTAASLLTALEYVRRTYDSGPAST
jgi:methylaspartate mutase epsilon subunit